MRGLPFFHGVFAAIFPPSLPILFLFALFPDLLPFFMGVRRSSLRPLFFSLFRAPVGRLFDRPLLLRSVTPWLAFLPPSLFFFFALCAVRRSPRRLFAALPLPLATSCRLGCGLLSLAFCFPTGRFLGRPVCVSPSYPLSMPPSWPLDAPVPWPLCVPPPWPGRSVYRLLSHSACQFLGRSVCRLLCRSVCRLLCRSVCRLLRRSLCRLLCRSMCRLLGRVECHLPGRSVCRLLTRSACRLLGRSGRPPSASVFSRLPLPFRGAFFCSFLGLVSPAGHLLTPVFLFSINFFLSRLRVAPSSWALHTSGLTGMGTRAPRVLPPPSGTFRLLETRQYVTTD